MGVFSQNFFNLKLNNENTEKILLGQKGKDYTKGFNRYSCLDFYIVYNMYALHKKIIVKVLNFNNDNTN